MTVLWNKLGCFWRPFNIADRLWCQVMSALNNFDIYEERETARPVLWRTASLLIANAAFDDVNEILSPPVEGRRQGSSCSGRWRKTWSVYKPPVADLMPST